ncbi:MAG: flavin reductase family protein [Sphingobacteriaceae bacterium]|nr:flavin reductase family protein [Cytophagaceae bacterium]
MKTFDPAFIPLRDMDALLKSAVAPRPIAFASTVDGAGRVNLSPFSYFNLFGINPPTLVFSPNNRVRDNTPKHTLENLREVPEVVVNLLDYHLVQQASLASTEYPKEVNEFGKAGLTEAPSERVRPPRVAECPVAMEALVRDIVTIGSGGGSANLVICEVVLIHVSERLLNENNQIDQKKTDWVARLGGDWYCRASGSALFEVPRPNQKLGIGFDGLPEEIRSSIVLTGNELAQLANVEALPDAAARRDFAEKMGNLPTGLEARHWRAREYIAEGRLAEAWLVLLA